MLRTLNRLGPTAAAGLLAAALAAGCARPAAATFAGSRWTPPIVATPEIAAIEREMLALLNRDRGAHGLLPLGWDAELADVGRAHSLDMRDRRFFAHESPATGVLEDRLDRAGVLAYEMRENLAMAGDIVTAQQNLLASPGHRANILAASVTTVGIGVVFGDPTGDPRGLTVTQVFARRANRETPEEAASKVRRALVLASAGANAPLAQSTLLDALASAHVAEVLDGSSDSLARIGAAITKELGNARNHGLRGLRLVSQTVFEASGFEVPADAREPTTRQFGLASRAASDARGRPKIRLLLLLAR